MDPLGQVVASQAGSGSPPPSLGMIITPPQQSAADAGSAPRVSNPSATTGSSGLAHDDRASVEAELGSLGGYVQHEVVALGNLSTRLDDRNDRYDNDEQQLEGDLTPAGGSRDVSVIRFPPEQEFAFSTWQQTASAVPVILPLVGILVRCAIDLVAWSWYPGGNAAPELAAVLATAIVVCLLIGRKYVNVASSPTDTIDVLLAVLMNVGCCAVIVAYRTRATYQYCAQAPGAVKLPTDWTAAAATAINNISQVADLVFGSGAGLGDIALTGTGDNATTMPPAATTAAPMAVAATQPVNITAERMELLGINPGLSWLLAGAANLTSRVFYLDSPAYWIKDAKDGCRLYNMTALGYSNFVHEGVFAGSVPWCYVESLTPRDMWFIAVVVIVTPMRAALALPSVAVCLVVAFLAVFLPVDRLNSGYSAPEGAAEMVAFGMAAVVCGMASLRLELLDRDEFNRSTTSDDQLQRDYRVLQQLCRIAHGAAPSDPLYLSADSELAAIRDGVNVSVVAIEYAVSIGAEESMGAALVLLTAQWFVCQCDRLAVHRGLWKVGFIGDRYLAASSANGHAVRACQLAFDGLSMLQETGSLNLLIAEHVEGRHVRDLSRLMTYRAAVHTGMVTLVQPLSFPGYSVNAVGPALTTLHEVLERTPPTYVVASQVTVTALPPGHNAAKLITLNGMTLYRLGRSPTSLEMTAPASMLAGLGAANTSVALSGGDPLSMDVASTAMTFGAAEQNLALQLSRNPYAAFSRPLPVAEYLSFIVTPHLCPSTEHQETPECVWQEPSRYVEWARSDTQQRAPTAFGAIIAISLVHAVVSMSLGCTAATVSLWLYISCFSTGLLFFGICMFRPMSPMVLQAAMRAFTIVALIVTPAVGVDQVQSPTPSMDTASYSFAKRRGLIPLVIAQLLMHGADPCISCMRSTWAWYVVSVTLCALELAIAVVVVPPSATGGIGIDANVDMSRRVIFVIGAVAMHGGAVYCVFRRRQQRYILKRTTKLALESVADSSREAQRLVQLAFPVGIGEAILDKRTLDVSGVDPNAAVLVLAFDPAHDFSRETSGALAVGVRIAGQLLTLIAQKIFADDSSDEAAVTFVGDHASVIAWRAAIAMVQSMNAVSTTGGDGEDAESQEMLALPELAVAELDRAVMCRNVAKLVLVVSQFTASITSEWPQPFEQADNLARYRPMMRRAVVTCGSVTFGLAGVGRIGFVNVGASTVTLAWRLLRDRVADWHIAMHEAAFRQYRELYGEYDRSNTTPPRELPPPSTFRMHAFEGGHIPPLAPPAPSSSKPLSNSMAATGGNVPSSIGGGIMSSQATIERASAATGMDATLYLLRVMSRPARPPTAAQSRHSPLTPTRRSAAASLGEGSASTTGVPAANAAAAVAVPNDAGGGGGAAERIVRKKRDRRSRSASVGDATASAHGNGGVSPMHPKPNNQSATGTTFSTVTMATTVGGTTNDRNRAVRGDESSPAVVVEMQQVGAVDEDAPSPEVAV